MTPQQRVSIGACPACGDDDLELVSTTKQIPTNSCLLLESRDEAGVLPAR